MIGAHSAPRTGRSRPWLRWAARALSVAFLCLAVGIVASIVAFYHHSATVGASLLHSEQKSIAAATRPSVPSAARTSRRAAPARAVSCTPQRAGQVGWVLHIPAIGLTAPVVEGDSDAELAVAVGHNTYSSWPDGPGTVALYGHDVTWFHHLPSLRAGQQIVLRSACGTVTYRVVSSQVVTAGTPVPNTPGRLVLVTCYPLDALWYTNQRYVVSAVQVSDRPVVSASHRPARMPSVPGPGVPAPWSGTDTLSDNPVLLGALTYSGVPSETWSESPAPLDAAANLQDAYFAAVREAETAGPAGWGRLHPRVPWADVAVFAGQSVAGNSTSLQTTLDVDGARVEGGTVTAGPVLSDGCDVTTVARFATLDGQFQLVSFSAG